MSLRLAIITEIIAPYRIPVFNALAESPHIDLHIIFLAENDPTLRHWRVYKDQIKFSYEVLPSWRKRFGNHTILLNRGLPAALQSVRPDVVLCGGYNYLASWQAAEWARQRALPFLLWSESTALDRRPRYRFVEFMKKRFLNRCTAFVAAGKSSANYLQSLGVPGHLIFIAPNAVDTAFFSTSAEAARRQEVQWRSRFGLPQRYFLHVGRLVEEKGVFDLLDAYAELTVEIRRNFGLVFAGTGAQQAALQKRASTIDTGCIQFLDFIHREELPAIYALAEALIFPTHSDPWGLVVNEAMACGLPVVVTNVAGCALDLVEDGDNGLVIPPRDPSALRHAMATLATSEPRRLEMGRESKRRVQAHSPARWARGILQAVEFARPA